MGTPSCLPCLLHHIGMLRSTLPHAGSLFITFPYSPSYICNPTHSSPSPSQVAPFTNLAGKPRLSVLWILNRNWCRMSKLWAGAVESWTHKPNFGFHWARVPPWHCSRDHSSLEVPCGTMSHPWIAGLRCLSEESIPFQRASASMIQAQRTVTD